MGTQCFIAEDTGRVKVSLRRFCWSKDATCPGPYGYHNASVEIGEAPEVINDRGYLEALETPHDDPRWPLKCDGCGVYIFEQSDQWQTNQHPIYRLPSGGEVIDQDLPTGAFRKAWWLPDSDAGPLGKWLLRLPNGKLDWSLYGASSSEHGQGPAWTITGDAVPNVSASPSINAEGVWHGYLQNGVLNP